MASPCYVKVYFTKAQQQQPEIRRFAIDVSPDNNLYQELCTKIATYQPDIQLPGFTLQYIDEESERITFSSNEELRSAIASNKDTNALKIFVTINRSQNTSNREEHTGVQCDGCQGSIAGVRYKCVICPNFDLCETCSSAGLHSEHNMIKISKPGNFYHPYGPRHHARRHRFVPPSPPASLFPSADFLEQIQTQIPQWLPNRETTDHFRAHMQQHLDILKTNTQTHVQNSKHYLENVGQYLQQALSPLGIDCDYRVDGQAPTSETTARPEPSAVPKTPTTSETNEQQQPNGISSLLNMFRTADMTAAPTPPAGASEKTVEECVEKLKAMGFDENDESLLQLIRSKQGDLNSVLDEINTRHQ